MKPFGCIDITSNKKNERINGAEFIVESTSSGQTAALERATEQAEGLAKKARLPLPLRIVEWVTALLGLTLIIGFIRAIDESEGGLSLSEALENAYGVLVVGGISLLIAVILYLADLRLKKKVGQGSEFEQAASKLEGITANIGDELGIPENAVGVDLLTFCYIEKKGKISPKNMNWKGERYSNPEMKLFCEGDRLCLADLEHKYAIERTSLRAIRTVKKRIVLTNWNKDTHPCEGRFKVYKMAYDARYNQIGLKPYHILEFEQNGEAWGIYFPCYELPAFEAMTGLKAE